MAVIAIIDDNINITQLKKSRMVRTFKIAQGHSISTRCVKNNSWTHATIVAAVLEYCTDDYEIVNIQIMDCKSSANMYTEKSDIEGLISALELCIDLNVDIVNMSIGSTEPHDMIKLQDVIRRAYQQGIIMVASSSNSDELTVPAAFSEVIGVQCDRENKLCPGQYVYDSQNLLHIDVMVNCDFQLLFESVEGYMISNSFAAPVITAKINSCWNKGLHSYKRIIEALKLESQGMAAIKREDIDPNEIYNLLT